MYLACTKRKKPVVFADPFLPYIAHCKQKNFFLNAIEQLEDIMTDCLVYAREIFLERVDEKHKATGRFKEAEKDNEKGGACEREWN